MADFQDRWGKRGRIKNFKTEFRGRGRRFTEKITDLGRIGGGQDCVTISLKLAACIVRRGWKFQWNYMNRIIYRDGSMDGTIIWKIVHRSRVCS